MKIYQDQTVQQEIKAKEHWFGRGSRVKHEVNVIGHLKKYSSNSPIHHDKEVASLIAEYIYGIKKK